MLIYMNSKIMFRMQTVFRIKFYFQNRKKKKLHRNKGKKWVVLKRRICIRWLMIFMNQNQYHPSYLLPHKALLSVVIILNIMSCRYIWISPNIILILRLYSKILNFFYRRYLKVGIVQKLMFLRVWWSIWERKLMVKGALLHWRSGWSRSWELMAIKQLYVTPLGLLLWIVLVVITSSLETYSTFVISCGTFNRISRP